MKASKKSIHARLYNFTYYNYNGLPTNLCPYFWKLVWATIVFIPNFIIQFPHIIIDLLKKKRTDCDERREYGSYIWISLIMLSLYIFITKHWIMAMYGSDNYRYVPANFGLTINCILIGCVMIGITAKIIEKRNENKTENEIVEPEKPSIIVEFIKAKYNKYCPTIEWQDNNVITNSDMNK